MRIAVAVLACLGLSGCVYYLNPLCTDLIRNGEETDIDCGGTCGPCDIGARCTATSDCDQSTCERGRCAPLPCFNGIQDGEETDVDCGGGTCRKCAGARTCEVASDCFSETCVAATGTCSSLATVSFAEAVPYASGDKTYALFSGDLDGDGDPDLAAANEQASTISVFLNDGAGGFTRLDPFPTGVYPTGGAIADLNDDGVADVVTADYRGDSVSVLLGTGMGVLGPRSTYPTIPGSETSNLAVGDLDRDGNLDVIATNPSSHSVSMFLGRADGTLEDAVDLPVGITGSSRPYSVAIGDFDRDGTDDVAIADVQSRTLVVRLGNGDATFGPEVPYFEGGLPPYILITRDMDLDGNLDLVCANRASDDVSVLLGRGDGDFRKAVVSSTGPGTGPYSVAVADFNRDGVPDVVTANYLASTGSVLLGIGDGAFEAPIDAGATGLVTYGVAAADFNGDGKPDFATGNAASNDVTVKLSTAR
jgi:hypothetical protein